MKFVLLIIWPLEKRNLGCATTFSNVVMTSKHTEHRANRFHLYMEECSVTQCHGNECQQMFKFKFVFEVGVSCLLTYRSEGGGLSSIQLLRG